MARVGHPAARKLVGKTGDERLNLEVVREEEPSNWGCCLAPGWRVKGELVRWAEARV